MLEATSLFHLLSSTLTQEPIMLCCYAFLNNKWHVKMWAPEQKTSPESADKPSIRSHGSN